MSATAVDEALLRAAVAEFPADELTPLREAALSCAAGLALPGTGEEDWKYTNLSEAAKLSNSWLGNRKSHSIDAGETRDSALFASLQEKIDAHWIVVRNGFIAGDHEAIGSVDGLTVARLTAADEGESTPRDALSILNSALLRDGVKISVASGCAVDKPVAILYLDDLSDGVCQTRTVVEAAGNSRLKLIEVSASDGSGRQFTNAVTRIATDRGACVDHVRIQQRGKDHTGVNRISASLAQDASYRHNSFDLGGAMTRNDVVADIVGKGAAVSLNGLYLASGDQHIDNHTSILHRVGPATSDEEYRGILGGHSQCVFNGKVVVKKGADGTDSSQSNHNLLLSERAEIDTKPELEIYADDVKCAHGATVGQLDESALFYLRSRGLDESQARQALTRAFAAGTLSALAIGACHDYLAEQLEQRLEALVGELE